MAHELPGKKTDHAYPVFLSPNQPPPSVPRRRESIPGKVRRPYPGSSLSRGPLQSGGESGKTGLDKQNISPYDTERQRFAADAVAETTAIERVEQFGAKRSNFAENRGPAPNKPATISYKIKCSKVAHNCPHPSHIRPLIRPHPSTRAPIPPTPVTPGSPACGSSSRQTT